MYKYSALHISRTVFLKLGYKLTSGGSSKHPAQLTLKIQTGHKTKIDDVTSDHDIISRLMTQFLMGPDSKSL